MASPETSSLRWSFTNGAIQNNQAMYRSPSSTQSAFQLMTAAKDLPIDGDDQELEDLLSGFTNHFEADCPRDTTVPDTHRRNHASPESRQPTTISSDESEADSAPSYEALLKEHEEIKQLILSATANQIIPGTFPTDSDTRDFLATMNCTPNTTIDDAHNGMNIRSFRTLPKVRGDESPKQLNPSTQALHSATSRRNRPSGGGKDSAADIAPTPARDSDNGQEVAEPFSATKEPGSGIIRRKVTMSSEFLEHSDSEENQQKTRSKKAWKKMMRTGLVKKLNPIPSPQRTVTPINIVPAVGGPDSVGTMKYQKLEGRLERVEEYLQAMARIMNFNEINALNRSFLEDFQDSQTSSRDERSDDVDESSNAPQTKEARRGDGNEQLRRRRLIRDHFITILYSDEQVQKSSNLRVPWRSMGSWLASHHQRLLKWPESIDMSQAETDFWHMKISSKDTTMLCNTIVEDWTPVEKRFKKGTIPIIVSDKDRVMLRLSDVGEGAPDGRVEYHRVEARRHFREMFFGDDTEARVPWSTLGQWLYNNQKRLLEWPHSIELPRKAHDLNKYTAHDCRQLRLVTLEDWTDDEKEIIHSGIPLIISDKSLVLQTLGDLEEFKAIVAKKGKKRAITPDIMVESEYDSHREEIASDESMDSMETEGTSYCPKVPKRKGNYMLKNRQKRQRRT